MNRSGNVPEPPLHAPVQLPVTTQLPTQLTGQQAGEGRGRERGGGIQVHVRSHTLCLDHVVKQVAAAGSRHDKLKCSRHDKLKCRHVLSADREPGHWACCIESFKAVPTLHKHAIVMHTCEQLLLSLRLILAVHWPAASIKAADSVGHGSPPVLLQSRKRTVPPASEHSWPPHAAAVVMV